MKWVALIIDRHNSMIYGSQLLFHEEILTIFFMLKLCSMLDLIPITVRVKLSRYEKLDRFSVTHLRWPRGFGPLFSP